MAKPLNAGVKGKPHSRLRWTVEMRNAFRRLKQLVAEAAVLKIPDHNKEFTLIDRISVDSRGVMVMTFNGGRRKKDALFGVKEIKRIAIPPE